MLNLDGPVPLYHQVKTDIVRKIGSAEWAPGDIIPSERELISHYEVSRTTIRQAVDMLVSAGLLVRVHGKGTFVAQRKITHTLSDLTGFVEELELRGIRADIELLSCTSVQTPPNVARSLRMPSSGTAWAVKRLVRVGGDPLFTDCSYFPPEFATVLSVDKLARSPLYRLLEMQGLVLVRGSQEIAALGLDSGTAKLLDATAGAPALAVTRTTYSTDDRPLEWSQAVYRADRYTYLVELRRAPKQANP